MLRWNMKQIENSDNQISGQATDLRMRSKRKISITSPWEMNSSFDGKSISNNRLPYSLTLENNLKPWSALIDYNQQNLDCSKLAVLSTLISQEIWKAG